jgi:hypothetical protein
MAPVRSTRQNFGRIEATASANSCAFPSQPFFVVYLPVSQDPTAPIACHLKFVPQRYAFRPNFQTWLT